jgi:hypothetical protein
MNLPGTRTCPGCHAAKPVAWFHAADWMASEPLEADWCAACQEQLRLVWAKRLELFFEQVYRPVAAA